MLVRISKREDPDHSDLGLPCLFMPFRQAYSACNFRTSIVCKL